MSKKLILKKGRLKHRNLQCHIDRETHDKVMKLAMKNNASKSDILKQLINFALENLE